MIKNRVKYDNSIIHTNGNETWFSNYVEEYDCDKCGEYIHESHPHYKSKNNNYHLCWDCSFLEEKIDSEEYLKYSGGLDALCDAYRHQGKIVLVKKGRKPPWEKSTKSRFTPEYREWRKKVYERDDYTCQKCGEKGGKLNAHHIKEYAKYPNLRLDINNGITLCEECHKKEHWGD